MARKRKGYYPHEITNINDDPSLYVDRNEIMRLTKMAKAWEFTCSFCFKKFPSAQAMGGHQNAHRNERMEEKRLYIKDPIGYRKRTYIQSMKEAAEQSSTIDHGGPNPSPNLHAAKQVVKYEFVNINGPPKILQRPLVMNFLPPKELSLTESVGGCAEEAKGKGCMEFNVSGYGMYLDQKLDLTLKL